MTTAAALALGIWDHVGGRRYLFETVKTFVLGKVVKTLQYPNGDLRTVTIRFNTINAVKKAVVNAEPPLYPGVHLEPDDVKGLALFVPPHFTEELRNSYDIRMLTANSWVYWTQVNEMIPTKGMDLENQDRPNIKEYIVDKGVKAILFFKATPREELAMSDDTADRLIDLFIEQDARVLEIYNNYHLSLQRLHFELNRYLDTIKAREEDEETP
mmetsp:Transcript_8195/g.9092  ORF Transcript_8195/g.9092 Transcript_8195/m.9092 type:complete len:213 (+) Transcript_8195:136-774(+)